MQLRPSLTLPILLLLFFSTTFTTAHNITRILAKHPEFSTFNHYLTTTHLAAEINRRQTITVCVVDNAGMSDILSKHYSIYTIKNILSLHVFADYFGSKKLHQLTKSSTLTSTMYQATGMAPGTSGFVNITDMKGGKVGFASEDNDSQLTSTFVKSVEEIPYNISVIQVSHIISSPAAEAPAAGPSDTNLTTLMTTHGCKSFSDLLVSSGAEDTFVQNVEGGLTVFCPSDEVLDAFMPKYNNLTKDGKTSLLLYHAIPFYNSLGMLRSSNGIKHTLATDGAKKYDFRVQKDGDNVQLKTLNTASITGTLLDEEPLALYQTDMVLMPKELFTASDVAEVPAAAPKASHPTKKGKKGMSADATADAPGPSGVDEVPADDSPNGSVRLVNGGWQLVSVAFALGLGHLATLAMV